MLKKTFHLLGFLYIPKHIQLNFKRHLLYVIFMVLPIHEVVGTTPELLREQAPMLFNHQDTYDILGLGSPCIDLIIPVEEEFLAKIPGTKGGALMVDFESMNEIIQAAKIKPRIATGGSCANALKGLTNLGWRCAQLGRIGQDAMGDHYIDYIQKIGMISLLVPTRTPTSRVLCLITPDGQRTMRFFEGASREMSHEFLLPHLYNGVKLVHIEGYALRNGNLVETMMKRSKEAGAQVSFDLSCFELVQEYRETILDLLEKYVDIVFANDDETFALTGLEPMEGALFLKGFCTVSVVLEGANGCWIGSSEGVFHSSAFKAQIIDTTGAGDLFASGFLYGYLKNLPLETCAYFGNLAGHAIVEVSGAELPEERWTELRSVIRAKEAEVAECN